MIDGKFLRQRYLRIEIYGSDPQPGAIAYLVWGGTDDCENGWEGLVMNKATGRTITEALSNLMEQMTEDRQKELSTLKLRGS